MDFPVWAHVWARVQAGFRQRFGEGLKQSFYLCHNVTGCLGMPELVLFRYFGSQSRDNECIRTGSYEMVILLQGACMRVAMHIPRA